MERRSTFSVQSFCAYKGKSPREAPAARRSSVPQAVSHPHRLPPSSPAGGARGPAPAAAASPGMLQRGRGGGRGEAAAGPCRAGRRPEEPGWAEIPKGNPRLPSRCPPAASPGDHPHPRPGRAMVSPGSAGASAGASAASSLPCLLRTWSLQPPLR